MGLLCGIVLFIFIAAGVSGRSIFEIGVGISNYNKIKREEREQEEKRKAP